MSYHARTQQLSEQRFRDMLSEWLATLPAEGWSGSVADLFAALESFRLSSRWKPLAFTPAGPALSKRLSAELPTIAAAGLDLAFTRTSTARTITITRRPS